MELSSLQSTKARIARFLASALLPLLVAVYPVLFHYSNNAGIALPTDFVRLSSVFAAVALLLYGLGYALMPERPLQAGNAATVFLVFFHTYGILFKALRSWDAIRIDHFTLLPAYVLLALQTALLIARLRPKQSSALKRGATVIISVLLVYNAATVLVFQLPSTAPNATSQDPLTPPTQLTPALYPDIYYLIFDEMAGFQAMRQYWHNDRVEEFVAFLKSQGFYVAENSHGNSTTTPHLLAQSLNYEVYPPAEKGRIRQYERDASNARIFRDLAALGYTTVAFDESRSAFGFPAGPPLAVDYLYENPSGTALSPRITDLNDFMLMVAGNTMLQPLIDRASSIAVLGSTTGQISFLPEHAEMVAFTMRKLSQLDDVPNPKFVYVHLMLPHYPFMFKPDGSLVLPSGHADWRNYEGNYEYTMKFIEAIISQILAAADPDRPSVIVIQSDHGARNNDYGQGVMPGYPPEFRTLIVNAMLLPGCDQADLTQDMNRINTFPIILNCYFDADIPLVP